MFVHDKAAVRDVLRSAQAGLNASAISDESGVPRSTVRDWLRGDLPASYRSPPADAEPRAGDLPPAYAYLLGLYLGDGCISAHRRGVFKLRISLDAKYPGIIAECRTAIAAVAPQNRVWQGARASHFTGRPERTCVEVSAYSKRWSALFPQHGRGRKHQRKIELTGWQWATVRAQPERALRGLIHSDGCRSMNTGRNWRHPRYSFHNTSVDILGIFETICGLLDVHSTRAPKTVYVSRMADVATLDRFIGPKR
jgi:hypothetical protein